MNCQHSLGGQIRRCRRSIVGPCVLNYAPVQEQPLLRQERLEMRFGALENKGMTMDKIRRGVARSQKRVYPKQRDFFQKLALGQRPSALFIRCADSRLGAHCLNLGLYG
jgi:hypothetical protein